MARDTKHYTLLDAAGPRGIASSTNASPIEITTAAPHGFATGDRVTIVGHLVNTNANGSWTATVTGAATLELDGSQGNGVGAATGIVAERSKLIMCADHDNVVLSVDTDGSGAATFTLKLVGSVQKNVPDFGRPQSVDNQYAFVQAIDLEDSVEINGLVGITVTADDVHKMVEANINGLQWLAVLITAGTAGDVTVQAKLTGNS